MRVRVCSAWRQTTFFPFSVTSRLAKGEVLRPQIDAGTYSTKVYGDAPLVDAVATVDGGKSALFLVNRSQTDSLHVELHWQDCIPANIAAVEKLARALYSGTAP